MADDKLSQRIVEVSDGVIGVLAGLEAARKTLGIHHGDLFVTMFLDKAPEKGEALWKRFKAYQKEFPGQEITFVWFMSCVLCRGKGTSTE